MRSFELHRAKEEGQEKTMDFLSFLFFFSFLLTRQETKIGQEYRLVKKTGEEDKRIWKKALKSPNNIVQGRRVFFFFFLKP